MKKTKMNNPSDLRAEIEERLYRAGVNFDIVENNGALIVSLDTGHQAIIRDKQNNAILNMGVLHAAIKEELDDEAINKAARWSLLNDFDETMNYLTNVPIDWNKLVNNRIKEMFLTC